MRTESQSPAKDESLVQHASSSAVMGCSHGPHALGLRDDDIRVQNGLATLGPQALRLMEMLETRFKGWAQACGADAYAFPPMMQVSDLKRFDYLHNFPHLMLCVSGIRTDGTVDAYANGMVPDAGEAGIPSSHLQDSQWALPSAACYNVYLHLQQQRLTASQYITTVARCFRNETEYVSLRRLWGFTMREIVCVGSASAAQAHLQAFKPRILAFAEAIGLPLTTAIATDPFFDQRASRAVMQRLFPVKEEFIYGGTLAIASVNFHRNFFGERCQITLEDNQFASSSCVAFGLERWLFALLDHFGPDVDAIVRRLERV